MSVDLFPTILEMAGVQASGRVDGRSLVPLLKGQPSLNRDALYWHYPHYHPGGATPYGAIRAGSLRLIEFYEDGRLELYDLDKDVGERENLAAALPEVTRQLAAKLKAWREEVGAQMPVANPDYLAP
jgi:arylsulfatase A-like enzyme